MPLTNPNKVVTEERLNEYHKMILPYLGGNSMVACGGGYAPIGTVIAYMGTRAPSDFLICDGTVYNIADYTELADFFELQFGSANFFGGDGATTFAVPDLRGEFLRGTGTNGHANQGSGANVGVHQDGTEHTRVSGYESGVQLNKNTNNSNIHNEDYIKARNYYNFIPAQQESGPSNYGEYTSRPTNTSVLYCIKVKSQGNGYSLDEQIVGTWIDGKPIYQKTYTGNIDSSIIGWHSIDDDTTKVYISGSGVAIRSNGDMLDIQYSNCISLGKVNNKLSYGIISQEGRDIFSGGTYNFTLQYIKTTD